MKLGGAGLLSSALGFQFHKGTIETSAGNAQSAVQQKFQFHKGTIETVTHSIAPVVLGAFQFHKGTIETDKRISFTIQPEAISIP